MYIMYNVHIIYPQLSVYMQRRFNRFQPEVPRKNTTYPQEVPYVGNQKLDFFASS